MDTSDLLALCPFCGKDPFQYVFDGIDRRPVAIICCAMGIKSMYRHLDEEAENIYTIQALPPPDSPDASGA